MRVIVTRPAAQAQDWVRELRALGLDGVALPLIGIEALADAEPLRACWQRLADYRLVMFVSANAVAHFFAARPGACRWPEGTLAGSTGPGTTAALRDCGVPAAAIEAPAEEVAMLDSEALWARLRRHDWRGALALVVRGEQGRDWLADALRTAGAQPAFLAAYRRTLPHWGAAEQELLAQALASPQAHRWLFSSSTAVQNLRQMAADADWAGSVALASHPRIAQTARAAGFTVPDVIVAQPRSVVQALRDEASIQSRPL